MKKVKPDSRKSPPAPPAERSHEGFSAYPTPDPADRFFAGLADEPCAWNGVARVYRFRVTVERVEEPAEVVLARMVALYRATENSHERETLRSEAHRRFGVDLWKLSRSETAE